MNTIIIDYEKVYPYFNNETEGEFIFDDFKLIINDSYGTKKYKIQLTNGLIQGNAKRIDDNGNEISFLWELSDGKYKNSHIKATTLVNGVSVPEVQEIGFDEVRHIIFLLDGIMRMPREKEARKSVTKNKNEKTDKNIKHTYQNKTVFLLDDIVEYIRENELNTDSNTNHVINCPCWSVRGHYRHYKSGKVIFIQNYKKGKERDKIEPKNKTYTV